MDSNIELFLINIENIINKIFSNEITDIYTVYNDIYKFILKNIKSIYSDDILNYTIKIIEKNYLILYNKLKSISENLIGEYNLCFNDVKNKMEQCNKLFIYFLNKSSKEPSFYTKIGNKLWYKYIYKVLKFKLNDKIIIIIDKIYNKNFDNIDKKLVVDYFSIIYIIDNINNISSYIQRFKGPLFKEFYNIYLNDFFITKLNKLHNTIVNNNILEYTGELDKIFDYHYSFLKKVKLDMYYYEYYFIFQSFLKTKESLIIEKLKVLPNLLNIGYHKYNKLITENKTIDFIYLWEVCSFLNIFLENFYEIINSYIIDFIKDKICSNPDFNIIIGFSYLHSSILKNIKNLFFKKYLVNLINYKIKLNKINNNISDIILDTLNKIDNKTISLKNNKFIKEYIYTNKFPIDIYINFTYTFIKYNKESKIDEILIYYRNYLINRLIEIKNNRDQLQFNDILNKDLHIIMEFIKKPDPNNLLSKLSIIIKDFINSIAINKEFNNIYNYTNFGITVGTFGIWGVKSLDFTPKNKEFNKIFLKVKSEFNTYYTQQKYENRHIIWCDNLTKCDIKIKSNSNDIILESCNLKQVDLLYNLNTYNFIYQMEIGKYDKLLLKLLCNYGILKKEKDINNRTIYSLQSNIVSTQINIEREIEDLKRKLVKPIEKQNMNIEKVDKIIAFRQEDYINAYILRTLKHTETKTMDQTEMMDMIINKFGYDTKIIYNAIKKLEENMFIENKRGKYFYLN